MPKIICNNAFIRENSTHNTLQVNIKLFEVGMSDIPTSLLEKNENNNSRKRNYSKTIFRW